MSRYTYGAAASAARTRSRVADLEARLREAAEDRRSYHTRIREDADRIRSLNERLKRASYDLETARAEVEQLKSELAAARETAPARAGRTDKKAKKRTGKAADAPRFTAAEMRRRPGNPLGEARLMKAAAEAHRHGARKESA